MDTNHRDRRRKKKHIRYRGSMKVISFMLLFICGVLIFRIIGNEKQINAYSQQETEIAGLMTQAQQEQQEIEAESEYMQSDAYIEELARAKLGLLFEHAVIFIRQGR